MPFPEPGAPRSRRGQYLVAALVSGAAMAVLIWQADWQAFGDRLIDARAWPAAAGLAIYALVLAVTAIRLWRTLRRGTPGNGARLGPIVRMTARHSVLLAILPARLGDAYYPFMLRRASGISLGASIGNLLVLRVYDLTAVAILFLLALVVLAPTGTEGAGGIVLAAILLLTLMTLYLGRLLRRTGRLLAGRTRRRPVRIAGYLLRDAGRWARGLPRGSRMELLGYTVLRWLFGAFSLGLAFVALGLPLGAAEMLLLGSGLALSAALPLQTLGGFGVAEGALAGLLVLIGQDWGAASATAIAARLLWLLFPVVCLIGYTAFEAAARMTDRP